MKKVVLTNYNGGFYHLANCYLERGIMILCWLNKKKLYIQLKLYLNLYNLFI